MQSKFEKIFIHCSDSSFAHILMINDWHKKRGWSRVGYHLCIMNGYPTADWWNSKTRIPYLEGSVEVGRAIDDDEYFDKDEQGASVYGHNKESFSICLVGKNEFTDKQLNAALSVVKFHMAQFGLSYGSVFGHYEFDSKKTCPNIDMNEFRMMLQTGKDYGQKTTVIVEKPKPEPEPIRELNFGDLFKKLLKRVKNLL